MCCDCTRHAADRVDLCRREPVSECFLEMDHQTKCRSRMPGDSSHRLVCVQCDPKGFVLFRQVGLKVKRSLI